MEKRGSLRGGNTRKEKDLPFDWVLFLLERRFPCLVKCLCLPSPCFFLRRTAQGIPEVFLLRESPPPWQESIE